MSENLVKQKIASGAKIIDVRTRDEFDEGHYPGALHIPVAILGSKTMDLGPKNHPIVVYCASGARSAMAARILGQAGFTDVTNAGGLEDMPE